jgi:hypothetical protein
MKKAIFAALALGLAVICLNVSASTEGVDPAVQAKVDLKIRELQAWAKDEKIVKAVKTHNAAPPAEHVAMTQDKWKSLTVLDPIVRGLTKNDAAEFLKSKKTDAVTEAFVSDALGTKVAFLAKTTGWCHKGKAKHDVPMTGKTWQGAIEIDESTGLQQMQIAVPVFDGEKPIGSLVVGLSIAKLMKD